MGCSSSTQDVQELDRGDQSQVKMEVGNKVLVTDRVVPDSEVEEYLKKAREHSPTPTQDGNKDKESQILEQSVHKNVNKTSKKSEQIKFEQRRSSNNSEIKIVDVWNAPKRKERLQNVEHKRDPAHETVAHETEYDREGIDVCSTPMKSNTNDFVAPLGPRTSPDGIQFDNERLHKSKVLAKVIKVPLQLDQRLLSSSECIQISFVKTYHQGTPFGRIQPPNDVKLVCFKRQDQLFISNNMTSWC